MSTLPGASKTGRFGVLTRIMVLAGFYVVGGWLGRESGVIKGTLTLVWPPAGIALGAVLLFGYRYLPGVALGAFVVGSMVYPSLTFAMATAVGSCLGAAVCAYLLERLAGFRRSLERVRDVAGLACAGAVMGTTVNAAFTVLSLCLEGRVAWENFSEAWTLWWIPDCMAILVVCPFILAWGAKAAYEMDFTRKFEACVCGAGLIASIEVSFNSWAVQGAQSYPLAYLPYPFLIWSSLRFGQRGATTGTLLVSALAIYAYLHGQGPFVTESDRIGVTLLGTYIAVLSLTNLFMAAAATERDVAERAVRESEKRYRGVVEDQTELIWRFDPQGKITFVNQSYCQHYGKTREELVGTNFMPIIPAAENEVMMSQFASLREGNMPIRYDFKTTSAQGRMLWIQCAVRAIFEGTGPISEYQAVGLDVTSRKLAEEALQQSEERLSNILEHMADGLLIFDEGGRLEAVNPATERILGFSSAELAGQNVRNLLHLDSLSEFESLLGGRFQPRQSKVIELKAFRRNGTVFPVEMDLSKAVVASKRRFIGVMRDIAERKEIEEHSQHQQKLEAVGRLAGGIAHEFNNLMQAIIGYSNLLRRQMGPEADPEPSEQITRAVERASRLTAKLLSFSRKQVIQPKPLNLSAILSSLGPSIEKTLGEGILLELSLDPDAGLVRADMAEIEQVVFNLVQNAKDAMPEGGTLEISTSAPNPEDGPSGAADQAAEGHVLLAVRDTGLGMSAEVRSHLFEPFFTTKPKANASGLGLSIVYGIVKQSGGSIEVTSREGEGSTFRIFFRKYHPDGGELPRPLSPPPVTARIKNILLVEDEEIVREFIREILEAEGYIVTPAPDGQAALDLFLGRFSSVDLVVTDLMLPGISGRELAERILHVRPEIPILYMSGHTNDEVVRREILTAKAIFLQKPFRPEALLEKVKEAGFGLGRAV